jgi:hypothetical protein
MHRLLVLVVVVILLAGCAAPVVRPAGAPAADPRAGLLEVFAGLKNVAVDYAAGTGTVSYGDLPTTERLLVNGFAYAFQARAPQAFASVPALQTLVFRALAPMKDKYGHETRVEVLRFEITRATAQKIAWSSVAVRQLGPLLAAEPGCAFSVAPALTDAYAKWVAEK